MALVCSSPDGRSVAVPKMGVVSLLPKMGVVSQLPKMGRSAAVPKMGAVSGRRMLTHDGNVDVWPAPS